MQQNFSVIDHKGKGCFRMGTQKSFDFGRNQKLANGFGSTDT